MKTLATLDTVRFYATLSVFRPLPLDWLFRILRVQARVNYAFNLAKRRRSKEWLQHLGLTDRSPAEVARLIKQLFAYATFRRYLDHLLLRRDARDWPDLLTVEGWDRVEKALGEHRGVLLLTSHVGLPIAERWFLRTQSHRVYYLLRIGFPSEQDTSWRARFRRYHHKRYGLDEDDLFGNEELSVQYMKKAYDHLRRNGIVNITGDGPVGGGRRHPVTICGRPRMLPDGGISLARLSGAPIVPCFTSFDDRPAFHIEFQEPLSCPPGDLRDEARALAEAYAARMTGFITRHPTNVTNFEYADYVDR